jgi:hypothetical protein
MNDNKPKTHAIRIIGDLGARKSRWKTPDDVAIRVQDLELYYGDARR